MKIIIVVNKKTPLPVQVNAACHISFGLSLDLGVSVAQSRKYFDATGKAVSFLSDYPLIVFGARNSAHIREAHESAIDQGLKNNAFYECYISGTPEEQFDSISQSPISDNAYIALGIFGEDEKIRSLTRKFSLLKDKQFSA